MSMPVTTMVVTGFPALPTAPSFLAAFNRRIRSRGRRAIGQMNEFRSDGTCTIDMFVPNLRVWREKDGHSTTFLG